MASQRQFLKSDYCQNLNNLNTSRRNGCISSGNFPCHVLVNFYRGAMESLLTENITGLEGSAAAVEHCPGHHRSPTTEHLWYWWCEVPAQSQKDTKRQHPLRTQPFHFTRKIAFHVQHTGLQLEYLSATLCCTMRNSWTLNLGRQYLIPWWLQLELQNDIVWHQ